MGAFFTNYQVRGKSASEVTNALTNLVKSRAYVSPEKNEWVTVYDEASDEQDEKSLNHIAAELSQSLNTAVIAFLVHDSDISCYWLYQNGSLADEFNSSPDYFQKVGEEVKSRVKGNTDRLLPLCIAGTTREHVEQVIHPSDSFPVMSEEILINLARLLGIDEERMGLGFKYFDEEGDEMLSDASEFQPVGRKTAPKKAKSKKPAKQAMPINFDMFPIAVAMLTKCWDDEQEKKAQGMNKLFPGESAEKMLKQLNEGMDRSARDFLKRSTLPDRPAFEELKAARDDGPDSLAKLLIKRAPTQLGSIADAAIGSGEAAFVAALLANGMDPNTLNQHGNSLLSVAEQCQKPEIYNLLKSAIEKKS